MSLFHVPLQSITAATLQSLIDNQVGESSYIEYKEEVFEKSDEKKRLQFLASFAAFANAAGGDILIGARAIDGLPVAFPGFDPAEADGETLRIQQVLASSVEPRVLVQSHAVPMPDGRRVLVMRVPRSWNAPHAIGRNGHFLFYRRHGPSKIPMTLAELRSAFALSASVVERTRQFRHERFHAIDRMYHHTPLAVLHLVPFASSMETVSVDLSKRPEFQWMSPHKREHGYIQQGKLRYNLEGVMMEEPEGARWHTQLFRNGALEYGTTHWIEAGPEPHVRAWGLQISLVNMLPRLFKLQAALGVAPPITVMLMLRGTAGFPLATGTGHWDNRGRADQPLQNEPSLQLLEVVAMDFREPPTKLLKPVFDSLWNAAGQERCAFYNPAGEWIIDPSWLDESERL